MIHRTGGVYMGNRATTTPPTPPATTTTIALLRLHTAIRWTLSVSGFMMPLR